MKCSFYQRFFGITMQNKRLLNVRSTQRMVSEENCSEGLSHLKNAKKKEESDEEMLMQTITNGNFEEIENAVTPRAFQKCESNSLKMAMKVNFKIRNLTKEMGPEKERFNQLANTVEEFTTTLLDPLRSNKPKRKQFGDHILDDVLEVAIANEQKKFFTHPVVHEEMNRKWYGRKFQQRKWKWWQRLLFGIWCLFDLVFSPILLPIFSLMKRREERRMNKGRNDNSQFAEEEEEGLDKADNSQFAKEEAQGLTKAVPAGIVIVPKSQKVRVGDQVEFKCEEQKSGNPIASWTWYKDEEKRNEKGPILVIENVQESDKGTYTCEVKNNAGEDDMFTVTLTVDPLYLIYLDYLETPYYKFLRDTLSYIILLALHFGLCLAPSIKTISGLEWTIFVFFVGRYLVEQKQLREQKTEYLRDCWNVLDFISLMVYLVIFLLRVGTTIMPGSVANNRVLAIAGYLYGFNTLCLTLRTFGHVMEQSKFVGTIQIALFSILKEIQIVLGQFVVALLAFSITLTKIYMTEKSFLSKETEGKDMNIACSKSGVSCWWAMFTHLGWSLLGLSEESDPLASADYISETIGRVCFAAFLIIGAILLVNMLIALLSHTYQRTEDNSFKEWSFQRAITIQTYDAYDPIPVPLNIIYNIIMLFWCVKRACKKTSNGKGQNGTNVTSFFKDLEGTYFEKHTNSFPVTDANKLDLVLKETERNRQMLSQILNTTFTLRRENCEPTYKLPAWEVHSGIRIEGLLLTCEECKSEEKCFPGARYRTAFSPLSPHFEVVILEIGKKGQLGIGAVNDNYDNEDMPGWNKNSLGYHTSDGEIFHNKPDGKKTKGHAMARRGDLIRCTMEEGKRDDEVSFFFTLNGKIISTQDENVTSFTLKKGDGLYPYIGMADGCSVLARMYSTQ